MSTGVTAIVPIRSFSGMTRLSSDLTANQRHKLSTSLASVAVKAALGADLRVVIVSSDPEVRAWATVKGIDSIDDNGSGLSEGKSPD